MPFPTLPLLRDDRWMASVDPKPHRARSFSVPELVTEFVETAEAAPYGRGLALLLDPREAPGEPQRTSGQLTSGLWLDVQVRDGRPQTARPPLVVVGYASLALTLTVPVLGAVLAHLAP